MAKPKSNEAIELARSIGEKIRKIRKSLGLTQQEFSDGLAKKMNYTYIGKIERGDIMPSLKMLCRISVGLGVPVDFFFQRENVTEMLKLLPEDIRDIVHDEKKLLFFKAVKDLDEEDIPLVAEIIRILNLHREAQKTHTTMYAPSLVNYPAFVAEKKQTRKYKKRKNRK